MKRLQCITLFFIVLFFCFGGIVSVNAALVENSTWQGNLTYAIHSVTSLGDIDGDGDLDLAWAGCSSGNVQTCTADAIPKIYINNGTSLIENRTWQQNLTGNTWPSIIFGDIDNDGNLDLVIGGSNSSQTTKVYINNGTTLTENQTWQEYMDGQHEEANGPIALGDIDNDGDLDLIVVKFSGTSRIVYINNGTSLVGDSTWDSEITSADRVSTALVDIDNDNDLDLSVIGLYSTKIYMNNGTSLIHRSEEEVVNMDRASTAWGDVDNDGDIDLFLMGEKGACVSTGRWFYENLGSSAVEEILAQNTTWENSIIGLFYGFSAFGDYDNDGDLDLVINGQCGGTPYTKIYDNNGTTFVENGTTEANITSKQAGSLVWGDIDNDGDLDLIEIGTEQFGSNVAKVYINNITTPNTAPTPPTSFSSSYNNRKISLGWSNGSDAETTSNGLYYNLMIGTAAANHTIISGVYGGLSSSNDAGGLSFGYFGNMMQRKNLSLKVDRLSADTTYYWYVQTIDTGLKAGNWTSAQSFTTPTDMEKPNVTINAPVDGYGSGSYNLVFNVSVADMNISNVSLWGNWGGGWSRKQTNSSRINGTYIFSEYIPVQGTSQWYIVAYDNATNFQNSSVRSFSTDVSVSLVENSTWQGNLIGSTYYNTAVFGDIDNDGDLDLISTGCTWSGCTPDIARVYTNNGTSFVENLTWQQNLTQQGHASFALGDINNDGYLDLIISGGASPYTSIYINNGTSFVENSSSWAPNIANEAASDSVQLGDIDHDGDLDLIFPGMEGKVVYLNNGTSFEWSSSWGYEITDTSKISSVLADWNNDNRLDLTIMGLSGKTYINNGTSFVYDLLWNVLGGDENSIVAGDINNDGRMDVIEIGSGGICDNGRNIMINNGTLLEQGAWNIAWNGAMGCFPFGSLALGDYDNNGYLDVASIGGNDREIWSNNGTTFIEDATAEANITGEHYSSVIWGDVDNDGDLDLVVIRSQKVYINNITNPNTAPTAPTSFSSSYSNREIKLGWNNGSDAETNSTGLYYNLMIGDASANHTIVSGVYGGHSSQEGGGTTGGYFGNMMQRKNLTLKVDRLSADTTYYWYVQTIDTGLKAGNWTSAQSFTTPADIEKPDVTINAPVDYFNSSSYNLVFNVSVSDMNISNVSLWGNWTGGGWHLNETNSSELNDTNYIFTKDLTSYGDGTYKWYVEVWDNASNFQNMSIRTFTIDTINPNINITYPVNNTNYTSNTLHVNYTHYDANEDSCWYSNDSMSANTTLSSCENITNVIWIEGQHNVTVWVNDSVNNINSSFVTFNVDTILPDINISYPANDTSYTINTIDINYTTYDINLDACWYSNDSYSANTTLSSCENITDVVWIDGQHNVSVWANDSFGNINSSKVTFRTDTINPNINITYPVNNTNYTSNTLYVNYTHYDANEDVCWYSNDTYSANTSLSGCVNITGLTWTQGQHNVTIWINDTVNNMNSSFVRFTIDSIVPDINITTPSNNTNSTNTGLDVNYTATDTNLDACWYSNDTYSANTTLSSCENITDITWIEGQHNVSVWANDSFGNINLSLVSFRIDITAPVISGVGSSVTSSSATITWTTDESANSTVYYGTTTATTSSSSSASSVTSHSLGLTSLSASTLYYYNVSSCDSLNNCNTSSQNSFTTSSSGNGGNGGGGGSGGDGDEVTPSISEFDIDFSIENSGNFEAEQGDVKTFSFNSQIKHTITIVSLTEDSATLLILSDPITIQIKTGETKQIDMNNDNLNDLEVKLVFIVDGKANFYFTKLGGADIASEQELEELVQKEALFDVKVSVVNLFEIVKSGRDIIAEIEVFNVNNIGQVDVVVNYYLSDNNLSNKTILASGSDTFAVEAVTSFVRSLVVPYDAKAGKYLFNVDIKYGDKIMASSSAEFRVIRNYEIIAIVSIIILIVVSVFVYLWKIKKKESSLEKELKSLERKYRTNSPWKKLKRKIQGKKWQ